VYELERRLDGGETRLIAAGGDGTVNMLVSTVMRHGARKSVKVGAIGLGSSNDFHKPLNGAPVVAGAPLRVDFGTAARHDICLLMYEDDAGAKHFRHWLINASIGTTAEANRLFNDPDAILNLLKRRSADIGIVYAAARTIARYRPQLFRLTLNQNPPLDLLVKNLGIVKNPNFTGSLGYDSPYEPASGEFFIHHLGKTSALRLATTVIGLLNGRFMGRAGTNSWRARRLNVRAAVPFAVECDGEVVTTRNATFSVIPRMLQVCSR
jgi:diacylglycerol kinase family enzyme